MGVTEVLALIGLWTVVSKGIAVYKIMFDTEGGSGRHKHWEDQ
jgi:hypothetical protein